MKNKYAYAILLSSLAIGIGEFVASLILITHIVGLVFSVVVIISSLLALAYRVRWHKHNHDHYRRKYEKMGTLDRYGKQKKFLRTLLYTTIITISAFLLTFFVIRVVSLSIHKDEIHIEHFPENCMNWARDGCTRIDRFKSKCTRPGHIPEYFPVVYSKNKLNAKVQSCAPFLGKYNIIYQSFDEEYQKWFYHIALQSSFWGFIDDLYIQAEP